MKIIKKKQEQIQEGEVVNSKVFTLAGWDDTDHIEDSEKDRMRATIPAHEIEARSRGIPSVGSGMVYPVLESLFKIEPFEIPEQFKFVAGMDFGWANPTGYLLAAVDTAKRIVYIIHEYLMVEKTPDQHIFYMSSTILDRYLRWVPIVHDPAGEQRSQGTGKTLVQMYKESGLIKFYSANNCVEGVQKVLQMLQNGQLKIFSTCNKLLSEMRMYSRDEKGHPKKGNDHLVDCLRYIVMSGIDKSVFDPKYEQMTLRKLNYAGSFGGKAGYV